MRVRWAPSNTGADVHIGNVRTILYNYLEAKSKGGQTVFRIEDSDTARSKHEYAVAIANTLDWLGLKADDGFLIGGERGPYLQTDKLDRYMSVAKDLVAQGKAYYCYCTQEEMETARAKLPQKEQAFFRYPGICRDKPVDPSNPHFVIRLKAPTDGFVEWNDSVFGKMRVPNKENLDWVIMRSNGIPLYNFGCVIDDVDQGITHIIRGRDHIINTPPQMLIYQAMGAAIPQMAHLGMILGQDGEKLSKRHASVSISEYRAAGYTPSGILNYLARLGWGKGNQEIFSMPEMIAAFSINACGKNDSKFDPKKFAAIQYEHLKSQTLTPDTHYVELLFPFLLDQGYRASHEGTLYPADKKKILRALPLIRSRAKTLVEAADEMAIFLNDVVVADKQYADCGTEKTRSYSLLAAIEMVQEWSADNLRHAVKTWLDQNALSMKDAGAFLRLALTGRERSPELFQVAAVLDRDTTLKRLHEAARRLPGA